MWAYWFHIKHSACWAQGPQGPACWWVQSYDSFIIVLTIARNLETQHVPGMPYVSIVCVHLSSALGWAQLASHVFYPLRFLTRSLGQLQVWFPVLQIRSACPWWEWYSLSWSSHTLDSFCFLPFMAVCLLAAIFFCGFLPETKGKTLAEITAAFGKAEKGKVMCWSMEQHHDKSLSRGPSQDLNSCH